MQTTPDTEARPLQLMTGSERGPQLQQPVKPWCMASAQDTVLLCMMATRCRQPRGGRGNTAAGVVGDSKKTSRANQRRALGRTLLRLATPPPPPAVVPVRIRQSDQHTLLQRGLEGWHGPAACVRGAGSGQRAAGIWTRGRDRASPSHPFITPSPHIFHVAVTVHLPVNRLPMQIGGKAPPPLPHLPLPAGPHLPRIAAPPTCPAALPLI